MPTRLHYQRYGTGPRVVLAFHGYGQGHGHWRAMVPLLGNELTVYAFDLFYHGHSHLLKADTPLSKARLGEILGEFLHEQGISRFSLLAFSMGAKFALTAAEQYPEQVEQIWLIAPDGLQRQFWYALATYPPWMRGVLGRAVLRPERLLRFLGALGQRRLVPASLVRFAEWQLDSREKRLRVYRSWVGFRRLTFDLRRLAATLNRRPVPVTFFLGRHDLLIPHAGLVRFISSLNNAHTVLLEAGHAGLLYTVADYLRRNPTLRF
ncbi:alpha/beta fold hydrolase [Hymenobacter psychrotolerans]|uniref:Pimeloyl-ACP methyl ester carboxylesterase n=1 Tax=Hymenobacter psychrotolerans DSM 18569 TaxID=1121959 RepID=A0A1M7GTK9_9BACT|nr:alpha/beta fold hydrolase [Hymenobacter psychrotolerans]SHM19714.1 Pimeloyl-ACP methyl ester carboxylesterase [Hymenobacter psychrotolerans DSM 18569]